MERKTLTNLYGYLIEKEFDLPLYQAMNNINWLLAYVYKDDPIGLSAVMDRQMASSCQAVSLILSRNIDRDPKEVLVEWNNVRSDATNMFKYVLDMENFKRVMSVPVQRCPIALVGGVIAKPVMDFWSIVTATQYFLPIVCECKHKYMEVYNKNLTYANMLCLIENLMIEFYPDGWNYICSKVYQVVNETANGELLGIFVLKYLASLLIECMAYVDMCNIDNVIDTILKTAPEFSPKVLPPNEMF